MYLTILTLAHHVYTSEPGNLLNITGIYTGLAASSFPFTAPKIALVLRFTGNPTEYGREFEVIVTFRDQDGLPGPIPSERKILKMSAGHSGEDVHCTYVLEAFDIPFTRPGWYQFSVHVDGELVDELPVNVAKSPKSW